MSFLIPSAVRCWDFVDRTSPFSVVSQCDTDSCFACRIGAGRVDKIDSFFDCMTDCFYGLPLIDALNRDAPEAESGNFNSRLSEYNLVCHDLKDCLPFCSAVTDVAGPLLFNTTNIRSRRCCFVFIIVTVFVLDARGKMLPWSVAAEDTSIVNLTDSGSTHRLCHWPYSSGIRQIPMVS